MAAELAPPAPGERGEPLPCGSCGGKCCEMGPMAEREYRRIVRKYGLPRGARVIDRRPHGREGLMVMTARETHCAYLVLGACSIYEDRPALCRLYGTVPEMPCRELYPETLNQLNLARLIHEDTLLKKIERRGAAQGGVTRPST